MHTCLVTKQAWTLLYILFGSTGYFVLRTWHQILSPPPPIPFADMEDLIDSAAGLVMCCRVKRIKKPTQGVCTMLLEEICCEKHGMAGALAITQSTYLRELESTTALRLQQ